MRVLFDQNMPWRLRRFLIGHDVSTASEMGWSEIENGELLSVAEAAGFELFITGDQSISYQQNLTSRKIAIIELTKNNWPSIANYVVEISDAADSATAGHTGLWLASTCTRGESRNRNREHLPAYCRWYRFSTSSSDSTPSSAPRVARFEIGRIGQRRK